MIGNIAPVTTGHTSIENDQHQMPGVPGDALGNLGDRYFDTTAQRWYLKRWVANREGVGDSILFPINLFPSVGDFDFSVRVRRGNLQDGSLRIYSTPANSIGAIFLIPSSSQFHSALLFSSDQTQQYALNSSDYNADWHTIGARRVSNALHTLVDGVIVSTIADTSGWSPDISTPSTRCLFTANTASLSIKCCDLRLIGPGGSIIAPLNEGAGTTITNRAGANGTLTDGTPTNFWVQTWVPMDL